MYHKDLEVWKKSIELVKEIYIITSKFPNDEKFGIVSQMRRAAVSIPSNIAEGNARSSLKEAARFIDIAIGSIAELETQLIIAKELNYVEDVDELSDRIKHVNALALGLRKYFEKETV